MTGNPAPQPPQVFGRYQVLARIGMGGMAQVFKAYDPTLDRPVAIKVISQEWVQDASFAERFRREARAIAALRHPHIVQVYDFGEEAGAYYMVMEYVEGRSLGDRVIELQHAGRRLPVADTLAVLEQVASALDYAHARGVVHRDVKPANILLRNDDPHDAVLADFGLALMLKQNAEATQGLAFGTPDYISPEQVQRSSAAGPQSDIYSLGVVAYVLLTGQPPFVADTPINVAYQHLNAPPRPMRTLAPDVSPAVESAVLRALAKDPAQRYATAGAMVSALRDAVTLGRPPAATATKPSATQRVPLPPGMVWPDAQAEAGAPRTGAPRTGVPRRGGAVPPVVPPPVNVNAAPRPGRRIPWLLLAPLLALCLCALLGAYAAYSVLPTLNINLGAALTPATAGPTLTPSATPTGAPPSDTPTGTLAPSDTPLPATATPTDTGTPTAAPTATATPTVTDTATPTPTAAPTDTAAPTATPGPAQLVQTMLDEVEQAKNDGRIKGNIAKDLRERLQAVQQLIAQGNNDQARIALKAFYDYVAAAALQGAIPGDLALHWLQEAEQLNIMLGGTTPLSATATPRPL